MDWATVGTLEFYNWDFNTLVEKLGKEVALQKVAMYQSEPFANTPCVKNGKLLQSYSGTSNSLTPPVIPIVQAPQLTDSEFKDETDKGISKSLPPNPEKLKQWQLRQQAARRAKKYA
jgi:hypothetical protein